MSILFAGIAFAVTFPCALIVSWPIDRMSKRIPKRVVLCVTVLIGGLGGVVIAGILANGIAINRMTLGYATCGVLCALAAWGYTERALIVGKSTHISD
ncbi:MAG: hypothetical protein LBJ65_23810 [Burkholderia sp.]|uniref:hypothetical protein n=1 Tax=Burkholderia sp. TaxID=36773 RepID=UPI00282513EE|nr:hypothetical protein [Burkholderia sp.]MDR0244636.1 hypothetical protein [Burkholderia sp.]